MGNCGSNPKTNEAVPEPVTEEVKVEQKEHSSEANVVEAKKDETPNDSQNKSLGTLLNQLQKVEEAPKTEEVKAEPKPEEPKSEEVKVQEEKSKAEEAKTEA